MRICRMKVLNDHRVIAATSYKPKLPFGSYRHEKDKLCRSSDSNFWVLILRGVNIYSYTL